MNRLHHDVLNFLIEYKKDHPDFKFGLRERNTNQRLEKGIWFQGDETYAFVGLYQRGGGTNRTKSFGLVFWHRNENEYGVTIEVVFNEEKDTKVLKFYQEALNLLGGFKKESDTKYSKVLEGLDAFTTARKFLDNEKPKIDQLLYADGLQSLFITDQKFDNQFTKILALREKIENHLGQDHTNSKKYPLNQILYGPPGTGKTYHTINRALEIIDPEFYEENKDNREALLEMFEACQREGQVEFITFHQSLSYEDFIEGIKPKTQVDKENKTGITYEVEPGLFKNISHRALENFKLSESISKDQLPFETAFQKFKTFFEESENEELAINMKREGYQFHITKITSTNIGFRKTSGGTSHELVINTLKDIYNEDRIFSENGLGVYYHPLVKFLKTLKLSDREKQEKKQYILIIDEINRGNVSQIFGELITLIEESKRYKANDALSCRLPYSKDSFTVPSNLYIIGTMNTADRSVEALDTALRRRFDFVEMPSRPDLLNPKQLIADLWNIPKYQEMPWLDDPYRAHADSLYAILGIEATIEERYYKNLEPVWEVHHLNHVKDEDFTGINFEILLETINKRIEKLIDKDHCIGHSYFLNLSHNQNSEEELRNIFQNKIIPLLQEYFFGDLGKIELVIGKAFFEPQLPVNASSFFASNDYEDTQVLVERKVYKIRNVKSVEFDIIAAAKKIYQ